MKRKKLVILIIFALFWINANAQAYYFRQILDGLPNNSVMTGLCDSKGFMWFGTKYGLCRHDGYQFMTFNDLPSESILCLAEDNNSNIWVSTQEGLYYINPSNNYVTQIDLPESFDGPFTNMLFDGSENLWLTTAKGLYSYNFKTKAFNTYSINNDAYPTAIVKSSNGLIWVSLNDGCLYSYIPGQLEHDTIVFDFIVAGITQCGDNHLDIITTDGQLIQYNYQNKHLATLATINYHDLPLKFYGIHASSSGQYWISSDRGVFVYDKEIQDVTHITHINGDPYSLSSNEVRYITEDKNHGLWICTYHSGLNYLYLGDKKFSKFYQTSRWSINGKVVRSLCSDQQGYLWIGTEDGGLNKLDIDNQDFVTYDNMIELRGLNIHDMMMIGDTLWIATVMNGIYLYDTQKEIILNHYLKVSNAEEEIDFSNMQIECICRISENIILFGTDKGLYMYDIASKEFSSVSYPDDGLSVLCIYQDSFGIVWIGTTGNGIFCWERKTGILKHYTKGNRPTDIPHNYITCFFEDSRHRMWIGTEGGGLIYSKLNNEFDFNFETYTTSQGLPSNIISSINEDDMASIWISTSNGLAHLNPDNSYISEVYTNADGLLDNMFSYNASYSDVKGLMYFGSSEGLISFNPKDFIKSETSLPLFITQLGTRIEQNYSMLDIDEITIKSKDASVIRISYGSLNYSNPRSTMYVYQLQGIDKSEIFTNSNTVRYSSLKPGKYSFHVAIAGSDEPQSSKSLQIIIQAPCYASIPAFCLYFLIICLACYLSISSIIQKKKKEELRINEKLEQETHKEIYNAKINFFTNITHEIRTPLMLIKMPLDKIIASGQYTESQESDLKLMQCNTNRLFNLCNQLLAIRRIEKEHIKYTFTKNNFSQLVSDCFRPFQPMIDEQGIETFIKDDGSCMEISCDAEMVTKILTNLISNAIKYCEKTISIDYGTVESERIVYFNISNDGEIITHEEQENLFKPFYRNNKDERNSKVNGTGLGLPLAKALTELHKGTLIFMGEDNNFNTFKLTLPIDHLDQTIIDVSDNSQEGTVSNTDNNIEKLPIVLLAEDECQMRNYLVKELSGHYHVLLAANGLEALNIIQHNKVHVVVSDIIMPKMDGLDLCKKIKENSETNHIPVILITAAIETNKHLKTLESGANSYLEKPFSITLLIATINNLLKSRQLSQEYFSSSSLSHLFGDSFSIVDKDYLAKVDEIIANNMTNPNLSVELISQRIGTSKSTLYRKIKEYTNINPNEYIRICRLRNAAEMLATNKYRINEVADLTGFSSPSYFTRLFTKQFKISPTDFLKRQKDLSEQ